ncbi:hypothetical protein Ssi02_09680 [Sinosporangium siamense]|uniref:Sulfotransferase family protein n=1 Tax=Sinosporangium siamense TaxID=1367973 RepID=A0A919V699_9ACTN|nr:hypothetical protein Ssi02_09680 [Sinosporangium siamense]
MKSDVEGVGTLEIIGAGFGRTGTLSMKAALERLGFGPCYHAIEFMTHPDHPAKWESAFAGKPDWESVFEGYRSTVDFPGAAFWRELADAYPQAKVILTTRDPESWYASVQATILTTMESRDGAPANDALDWFRKLSEKISDKQTAIEWFNEHNEAVRAYIPADRLLDFEVNQG